MRPFFHTSLLVATLMCCIPLHAQTSVTNYPLDTLRSWTPTEAVGDLNKDGYADLVLIATPRIAENMKKNEAGYEFNFNPPVLAIYWGQKDGSYVCWRQYDRVIPATENEYIFITPSLTITPQGTLRIDLEQFSSAGSWSNYQTTFVYRYQQGDFYLIGEDEESMARNTGEAEYISVNYLTHKKQHRTYNAFDKKKRPKERWTNIPKKPLEKLGAKILGE